MNRFPFAASLIAILSLMAAESATASSTFLDLPASQASKVQNAVHKAALLYQDALIRSLKQAELRLSAEGKRMEVNAGLQEQTGDFYEIFEAHLPAEFGTEVEFARSRSWQSPAMLYGAIYEFGQIALLIEGIQAEDSAAWLKNLLRRELSKKLAIEEYSDDEILVSLKGTQKGDISCHDFGVVLDAETADLRNYAEICD